MKEINGYLLVGVHENSYDFKLYRVNNESIMLTWKVKDKPLIVSNTVKIDTHRSGHNDFSNYKFPEIIGLAKDLTEEQWALIVDGMLQDDDSNKPYNYEACEFEDISETESGHSLLKANNLNPNNCLILKKLIS